MRIRGPVLVILSFVAAACSNPSELRTPLGGASLEARHVAPKDVVAQNGESITVTGPVTAIGTNQFSIDEGSGGGPVTVSTSSSTIFFGKNPFAGENVVVTGSGSFGSSIAATNVAQQVVAPSGVLSLTGPISNVENGGFTIQDPFYGYTHVYTNAQTKVLGGPAVNAEYAQAVGPGSSSETASYVSLWAAAPSTLTASGTVAAVTQRGFTLKDGGTKALPVVLSSTTKLSSWPIAAGGQVTVTGAGALSRSIVASSIVETPPPGATPQPVKLVPGGVVGVDDRFTPPDGDTSSGGTGQTVDTIPCAPSMSENSYHVHAYVGLLVNGTQIAIPDQIGLVDPGPINNGLTTTAHCYYFIHTHDTTGMIHIESPSKVPMDSTIYTLGNVLDVWGESIGSYGFGPFSGQVRIFVDRVPLKAMTASQYTEYTGDPMALPMYSHEAIWIETGPPFVFPPPAVEFYTEY